MSAIDSDIITVFGATGKQGGSVINSLLHHTDYKIRAITRNKNSDAARQLNLTSGRIAVCEANCNDEKSLRTAFKGAMGAFLLTDFWKPENCGHEKEQAKKMGDAAKKARVKQIVFSTVPNVQKESDGKWNARHFTDKAEGDDYLRSLDFPFYTSFGPSFYYQNLLPGGMLGPKDNTFTFPDIGSRRIDMFDVMQTGEIVVQAFLEPVRYNRSFLAASGDRLSLQQIVDIFSDVQRIDYKLNLVKLEDYPDKELAQMFGWFRDFGYFGKSNINEDVEQVGDPLRTLREFLEEQPPQRKPPQAPSREQTEPSKAQASEQKVSSKVQSGEQMKPSKSPSSAQT